MCSGKPVAGRVVWCATVRRKQAEVGRETLTCWVCFGRGSGCACRGARPCCAARFEGTAARSGTAVAVISDRGCCHAIALSCQRASDSLGRLFRKGSHMHVPL